MKSSQDGLAASIFDKYEGLCHGIAAQRWLKQCCVDLEALL